jgi:hypothetical protein
LVTDQQSKAQAGEVICRKLNGRIKYAVIYEKIGRNYKYNL